MQYAEPAWLRKPFKNPYYTESHFRLQKEVRKFVDEVVKPEALRIEDSGEKPSQEFWDKLYQSGLGPMRLGPGKHLQGRKLFADIKPEEFNYFHELVIAQEFSLTVCPFLRILWENADLT